MKEKELVEIIKDHLKGRDDLLKSKYDSNGLKGHCYVASEVFFHLTGGYDKYNVHRVNHEGYTHWFLEEKDTEEIIDITKEQFEEKPTYEESTKTGFLTKNPSNRSKKVIKELLHDRKIPNNIVNKNKLDL